MTSGSVKVQLSACAHRRTTAASHPMSAQADIGFTEDPEVIPGNGVRNISYLNLHLGMAYSLPGFTPHTPGVGIGSR